MTENPDHFIPTHQSLLSRLKDWGDQESWRRFFDTYWRLIYNAARKSGLTETEAQDVVQETLISVAKKMPGFKYDPAIDSFKGWLSYQTRLRIADQFRKRRRTGAQNRRASDDTERTATIERVPDPAGLDLDVIWDEEWRVNLMNAATARVKDQVSPEQYEMFYLYAVKEISVRKVANRLRVNAAQIYMAKHRISRLLKKEIRKLEKEGF
jgi:RNA polymerase sigma-70 factor (ECF subfamily)